MKERIVSRPDVGYDEALPAYGERVPYSRQSGKKCHCHRLSYTTGACDIRLIQTTVSILVLLNDVTRRIGGKRWV